MEAGLTGPINLGTGEGVTVREIAQTLARLLGREGLVGEGATPAPDPLYYVVADPSRLRAEASWRPTRELPSGLEAVVESLRG